LVQILGNYLSNAIKYGRPGGHAVLTAARVPTGVRITVTDDGIGIAAEMHDRIFQPFQRAGQENGPIEGTGIGLAISKRLAELMHGRVGFTSERGSGSSFWVELPTPASLEASPPTSAPADDDVSMRLADVEPFDVVYVEDNAASVALIRALLRDLARVELRTATTAELGLELVRARRPDVVLMDINLPGMSGFEALRRLRADEQTRDLPVIALSAAARLRDRAQASAEGFTHYLTKPIDVAELTAVLERVLANARTDPTP
jgi:CheY-like chemotaxis protein